VVNEFCFDCEFCYRGSRLDSIRTGYAEPTAAVRDDEDAARDMTELPHERRRGEVG